MKSEQDKKQLGTYRKDQDAGQGAQPLILTVIPKPPKSLNKIELEFYQSNCDALLQMGALTMEAARNTVYYAPWYNVWHMASQKMRDGELYELSKTGWKQKSVFISICETATKMLQSYSSSHGLNPVNKSKVKVQPRKRANDLDSLINVTPHTAIRNV